MTHARGTCLSIAALAARETVRVASPPLRVGDFRASLEERRMVPSWIGWTGAGLGRVLVVAGLRSRRGA
jgi:hypothetical protein